MVSSGGWFPIESDMGVFNNIAESFGVRESEFADIWNLNGDYVRSIVSNYGHVYGLILIFKW